MIFLNNRTPSARGGRRRNLLQRPYALAWALLGSYAALAACPLSAQESAANGDPSLVFHTLRKGEGLAHLAHAYGVSVAEIVAANHLHDIRHLPVGTRLLIQTRRQRLSAPARQAGTQLQGGGTRVSLTFTKVDVRDVLSQIADYAHADILLTPSTTGSISINLRSRTAEEAIRMVAAVAGMSVAKVGGAYIVGPADEVQKAVGEFGQAEVIPLHFTTPVEAAKVLQRLAPRVRVETAKNGVILSGLPRDMDAARAALHDLDVEPPPPPSPKPATEVVSLHAVDPAEAERVLGKAFPDLTITRQEHSLILVGIRADLDAAAHALQTLDVETPKAAEPPEVFVYRLKYLHAERAVTQLKQVLSKAAPNLDIAAAPEATAPPPANFNPLSSEGGFGSTTGGAGGSAGGLGGSGSGGGTSGGVGGSGGAAPQPLSRPTRLMLIGTKADIAIARTLLEQTDVAQPTVRIEAVLIEVNTTDFKNLGITWDTTNTAFTFSTPPGPDVRFGGLDRSGASFTVSLQALITQNRARILARPNISVVDDEDASIFIGDMRRFLGSTITTVNSGTIQAVEALPVGIALLIRPRIHPSGEVTLKVHPVISTVTSVVSGLPQTSSREADTTVRLKAGEQLVIGGLDRSELTNSEQRLPILGDIPVLGEFFRTRSHTLLKTEIVVMIRAYPVLVEPAPGRDFHKGVKE